MWISKLSRACSLLVVTLGDEPFASLDAVVGAGDLEPHTSLVRSPVGWRGVAPPVVAFRCRWVYDVPWLRWCARSREGTRKMAATVGQQQSANRRRPRTRPWSAAVTAGRTVICACGCRRQGVAWRSHDAGHLVWARLHAILRHAKTPLAVEGTRLKTSNLRRWQPTPWRLSPHQRAKVGRTQLRSVVH